MGAGSVRTGKGGQSLSKCVGYFLILIRQIAISVGIGA